jgi:hypothetical protein
MTSKLSRGTQPNPLSTSYYSQHLRYNKNSRHTMKEKKLSSIREENLASGK